MNILIVILQFILPIIFGLIAYLYLEQRLFSKIKVSKWVIIGIAVIVVAIPPILRVTLLFQNNTYGTMLQTLQTTILVILFLWLVDVVGGKSKSKNQTSKVTGKNSKYTITPVIKAKAKPNRLKNTDMEIIQIKDIKKKKK